MKLPNQNLNSKELSALESIKRNGDLLWWGGNSLEAEKMFQNLKKKGLIEYNEWSGRYTVRGNYV